MRLKKDIIKLIVAVLMVLNLVIVPVNAEGTMRSYVEARYNNITTAILGLGFDTNNVAYCTISATPKANCTGIEGYMRLLDSNGNHVASWNLYDYTEPYLVEKTCQVEYGKTYTLTFQGYAYGEGSLFDDIVLSTTATCED